MSETLERIGGSVVCRCGCAMDLAHLDDDLSTEYAYNIYVCHCGWVAREDVWKDGGVRWLGHGGEFIDGSAGLHGRADGKVDEVFGEEVSG